MQQNLLLSEPTNTTANARRIAAQYQAFARTRLSRNFILRDLLFSTEAAALGLSNFPENPAMVVRAGRALCEKILEPVLGKFGRFAITFGYQSREAMEFGWSPAKKHQQARSSSPHQHDRGTFGKQVYARVDILPFCVEDREVGKQKFGHWLMHNLDVDLLMQWTRSNVFCITVSSKPRRVWLEWGNQQIGEPRQRSEERRVGKECRL